MTRLGVAELYVADLDAILGRPPQNTCVGAVASALSTATHDAAAGLSRSEHTVLPPDRPLARLPVSHATSAAPLWLDAGVSSPERAHDAVRLGAARIVVGLETLPSYDALAQICAAVGGNRVAFSLDLRGGEPVVADGGIVPGEPAHVVAARAAVTGIGAILVIDLGRVGTGAGLDVELIDRVREAAPELTLLAGGGVRGPEDLERLASRGCDGALVATALLDGRIGAADVMAARALGHRVRIAGLQDCRIATREG